MVEDLRRFSYDHIFASALPWSVNGIWQIRWLEIVRIYQYAKTYQAFPTFLLTEHIRTDGLTRWLQDTLRKSTFQSVDCSAGRAVCYIILIKRHACLGDMRNETCRNSMRTATSFLAECSIKIFVRCTTISLRNFWSYCTRLLYLPTGFCDIPLEILWQFFDLTINFHMFIEVLFDFIRVYSI